MRIGVDDMDYKGLGFPPSSFVCRCASRFNLSLTLIPFSLLILALPLSFLYFFYSLFRRKRRDGILFLGWNSESGFPSSVQVKKDEDYPGVVNLLSRFISSAVSIRKYLSTPDVCSDADIFNVLAMRLPADLAHCDFSPSFGLRRSYPCIHMASFLLDDASKRGETHLMRVMEFAFCHRRKDGDSEFPIAWPENRHPLYALSILDAAALDLYAASAATFGESSKRIISAFIFEEMGDHAFLFEDLLFPRSKLDIASYLLEKPSPERSAYLRLLLHCGERGAPMTYLESRRLTFDVVAEALKAMGDERASLSMEYEWDAPYFSSIPLFILFDHFGLLTTSMDFLKTEIPPITGAMHSIYEKTSLLSESSVGKTNPRRKL